VKLQNILDFYNHNCQLPYRVDGTPQFGDYKMTNRMHEDITPRFFVVDNTNALITTMPYIGNVSTTFAPSKYENQFSDYKLLNFKDMRLFIDKYFSFSHEVNNCVTYLINKYNVDCESTCGVFFRGNDKCKEIIQPSYDEMINKTKEVISQCDFKYILLQTDEREFSEAFLAVFPDTIVFTEIPDKPKGMASMQHVTPRDNRITDQQFFIASLEILSRCKQVVHTSGNCEMWMAFFRNNANGLHQYLRPHEIHVYNGQKNLAYDPNQTYFWIDN
jgi:hypothetical protein